MDLKKDISLGGGKAPIYPTKSRINLAVSEGSNKNTLLEVLLFIVFLVLLAIFCKFAIVDPLMNSAQASAELTQAKEQLASLKASNEGLTELSDKYSRYIVSDLTEEEQNLVNRDEVLNLLESKILNVAHLSSVKVSQNTVSITCISVDLQEVSTLVESLETDQRVSHVTVSTAQSSDGKSSSATINIELKGALDSSSSSSDTSGTTPGSTTGSSSAATSGTSTTEGANNGK